ncbi:hypothetical protein ACP70R_027369 [Stipagrostis hirtigluma subsp. patula]
MRRFLPTGGGGGGGGEPSSSSSSGGQHQHGDRAGLRYGGADISLGHGHDSGHHQFGGGGEALERQDGSMDMLARHSSSPAGFFSNLVVVDNGYPSSKPGGSGAEVHHPSTAGASGSSVRKMKPSSQLNFGRPQQGHLSQIAEDGGAFPPVLVGDRAGRSSGESSGAASRSFSGGGGFSIVGPWDESRDIIATLGAYDSQFSGGAMASTALEMAGMDRYMQLQQDQVPFKVRAKRGCATHPRSIAERERRTRISEKLRKLQDLVPNMDKQTSTADMLDLAVEHIKGLQTQLEALKHEQEKCTCCRKR